MEALEAVFAPPEQKVVSSNLTGRTNFIFSNQHLRFLYQSLILFQNQKRIKTLSGELLAFHLELHLRVLLEHLRIGLPQHLRNPLVSDAPSA